jgi:hypothetical protein
MEIELSNMINFALNFAMKNFSFSSLYTVGIVLILPLLSIGILTGLGLYFSSRRSEEGNFLSLIRNRFLRKRTIYSIIVTAIFGIAYRYSIDSILTNTTIYNEIINFKPIGITYLSSVGIFRLLANLLFD